MEEYHTEDILDNPEGHDLRQFVLEVVQDGEPVTDLEAFERMLTAKVKAWECRLLQIKLRAYDIDTDEVVVGSTVYKKVLRSSKAYLAACGEVAVERSLYRAADAARAICPLELRAGIVGGFWTPLAARQAAHAVAQLTTAEAEHLFDELGRMTPSRSSLDRLPKTLSDAYESHRKEWEEALRMAETIPAEAVTCAVSLDGVMVPMKDAGRAEKRSQEDKQPKGPAGYREAGCGTVSFYDAAGTRLDSVAFARMPEPKKATLTEILRAEWESVRRSFPEIRLVKLADGAEENWRFLETLEGNDAVEIVDFFHACEHLKRGLDAFHGENSPESKAEFHRLRIILEEVEGGVDRVIGALKYRQGRASSKARRKRIQTELTYFRNQRSRMDYTRYLKEGLPIGSGVVEAACKTLVTQRLKRSGMAWLRRGGQGILTLRSLLQSDRWDQGWRLIAQSFVGQVVTLSARRRHLAAVA